MAQPEDPPATGPARTMPPWLPKAFVLAATIVLLFAAGLWLLDKLQGLLLLLLTSLFLAFAIEPAVNWLAARGWRRGWATGVMFLLTTAVAVAFFGVLGSLVVDQATNLVNGFPEYADRLIFWINDTFGTRLSQERLFSKLPTLTQELSKHVSGLAGNVWGIGATALAVIFQGLGMLLFTFYLSAQGPQFRRAVCSLLPPHRQRQVLWAWEIAIQKTGGYIYSRALLALPLGASLQAFLSAYIRRYDVEEHPLTTTVGPPPVSGEEEEEEGKIQEESEGEGEKDG
ncbi:AI-2E family transporter [Actinomadura sp. 6N118]|uniref:AI-2E family transporter n=1 Tax=Actinomadura sp. 6N118 TaxID=3375151 RepID=UPI0037BD51AA